MSLSKPGQTGEIDGERPLGGGPNRGSLLFHSRRFGKRGRVDRSPSLSDGDEKEVKCRDKRIQSPRF